MLVSTVHSQGMGWVWLKLRLYGERLIENDGLCNLIQCFVMLSAMWAPSLWFLYHVIVTQARDLIVGLLFCLLFVGTLTAYFISIRHVEIRDFFAFFLLLGFAGPVAGVISLVRWLVMSVVRRMYTESFVVRGPRYRQKASSEYVGGGEKQSGRLCSTCDLLVGSSSLLIGTKWMLMCPAESYPHHSARELETSATECHLCKFLLRSVKANPVASGQVTHYESLPSAFTRSSKKLTVKVWQEREAETRKPILRLKLCGDDTCNTRPLLIEEIHQVINPHDCKTPCTTNSPSVMKLAKDWLESCGNHVLCQNNFIAPFRRSFRPTRLLKIDQKSNPPKLHLVETAEEISSDPPTPVDYVALSHCWGNAQIARLLPNNLVALKESIAFEELPLNFQHAVLVTIGIEVQYLWVDSLCIIQECLEDWTVEAPRMGLVYANAKCTISATASEDSHGGCFSSKDPFLADCALRTEGNLSLVVRSWVRDETLDVLFDTNVESAPLTKRGWAFQERVLSKRVLHFCKGFVFFECNTLRASEYHESGVPYSRRTNIGLDGKLHSSALIQRLQAQDDIYSRKNVTRVIKGVSTRPISRPAKDTTVVETKVSMNRHYKSQAQKTEELSYLSALFGMRGAFQLVVRSSGKELAEKMEFHQCWYEMVEQYSIRGLTQHTDKLMAVAGVAYFIQEHAHRIFLSGLWMSVLPFNLLWTCDETAVSLQNRPIRNLPTWSWASIDGRVSHRLKVVPVSESDNVTQKANLSSSKSAVEMFRTTWEHITTLMSYEGVEPLVTHNSLIHNAALKLTCCLFALNDVIVEFIPDINLDSIEETLFAMPILAFKNAHVAPVKSGVQVHGIVLQLLPTKVAAYERVGYFWTVRVDVVRQILEGQDQKCGIRLF